MQTAAPSRPITPTQPPASTQSFADATEQLPLLAPAALLRGRGLVVIAPHPDDESLGCGGLLAWASQHDVPVQVIFLTDGEQSHPGACCDVGSIRRGEALCACARLGITLCQIHFLGLPDAGLDTLTSHERHRATQSLRQLIAAHGPSLVVTTAETDPHCDHRAAFQLVKAVAASLPGHEFMAFPVWSWLSPDAPHALKGVRVAVADQLYRKRQAIDAYASQHGRLPLDVDGFTLPPELLSHVHTGIEVFLSAGL
jgi:LmbE family N-acetylglucosaminyl deacetylase